MKLLKGGTISLAAYFEDANGNPVTGEVLANILFDIYATDDSWNSEGNVATGEIANVNSPGWYYFDFTESEGKNLVYSARHDPGTYKNFPGALIEIVDTEEKSGSYEHPNVDTEQTILEETLSAISEIKNIFLDFAALTKDSTVRFYAKIDGANYREIDSFSWLTSDRDGVITTSITIAKHLKVTLQSSAVEGAVRDVPYRYTIRVF